MSVYKSMPVYKLVICFHCIITRVILLTWRTTH